jgi:uncharacterized protein (DUF1697 family)
MPVYISLLRGINVSGQKLVSMELLRGVFARLGFRDVQSYIQSGNIIFTSKGSSPVILERRIAAALLAQFGFDVPVLVMTLKELREIGFGNPFAQAHGVDVGTLHVTLLSKAAPRNAQARLQQVAPKREQVVVVGKVIYLQLPDGYGRTKLTNTTIEKRLAIVATTRNWRTLLAVLKLASTPGK